MGKRCPWELPLYSIENGVMAHFFFFYRSYFTRSYQLVDWLRVLPLWCYSFDPDHEIFSNLFWIIEWQIKSFHVRCIPSVNSHFSDFNNREKRNLFVQVGQILSRSLRMKGHFQNQIHKISQKCDFPSVKVISRTYTSQNVTVPTVHRILHAGVCMHSMTSLPWAESPMLWTLGHHRHHLSESLRPKKSW